MNDHDFLSSAKAVIIPHGIYDVKRNVGYMTLNMSKDTSEFCCDCVKDWWETHGKRQYLEASSILILADGGGNGLHGLGGETDGQGAVLEDQGQIGRLATGERLRG